MDPELIAYLDQRFRETTQQISALREETTQRFEKIDQRFEKIDQRFEKIDQRFEKIDQRFEKIDQRFEQIDQRFEQIDRRFEQIDRRFEQIDRRFEQVDQRFGRLEDTSRQTLILVEELRGDVRLIAEGFVGNNEKLERFQKEATLVFDEVKGWIEPYYRNLNGRLQVIEGRNERQQGDVLDAVRKMLGKPPLQSPIPTE